MRDYCYDCKFRKMCELADEIDFCEDLSGLEYNDGLVSDDGDNLTN